MKRIAILLVALVVASYSEAQSIIPRPDPATFNREGKITGDEVRRIIDKFAACTLGRRRMLVLEALALPSGSTEQDEALAKLMKSDCLAPGNLHFSAVSFRGSLYKALVRARFARKPAPFGPEPVDYMKQPLLGVESPPIQPVAQLLSFASCVIHKDPGNARDAVVSAAGSPKEDAAMAELAKVYGQCLFTDQKFRFSKEILIGLLAEAYYREANASAQGSGNP